jgi:hypothetical protein
MTTFLGFLAAQRNGILLLMLVLFVLCFLVNWVLWMFRWGRYGGISPQADTKLRLVLTDFFIKLINDFRHLLALVMVFLFAVALFLAMAPGVKGGNLNEIKDGVQTVAAALGGLIGSIIGYYFGESAGAKMRQTPAPSEPPATVGPAVQPDVRDGTIEPPPAPPPIQGA